MEINILRVIASLLEDCKTERTTFRHRRAWGASALSLKCTIISEFVDYEFHSVGESGLDIKMYKSDPGQFTSRHIKSKRFQLADQESFAELSEFLSEKYADNRITVEFENSVGVDNLDFEVAYEEDDLP